MTNNEDESKWDEKAVRSVLMNPFHTMGDCPTVDDATWIEAQKKLVDELGADKYFATFLALLKECLSEGYDA